MKDLSGVYAILCLASGKLYVGSSQRIFQRKSVHWATLRKGVHHTPHLQAAWKRYGEESFALVVLEEAPPSVLEERETWWISYLTANDRRFGYNNRLFATSSVGMKRTPEQRKRMSVAQKKRYARNPKGPLSIAQRRLISEGLKGHRGVTHSKASRLKIGQAHWGLREEQVRFARKCRSAGVATAAVARALGVSSQALYDLHSGKTYQQVV